MPVARKAEAGQEDDTSRMCGVCGFRPRVLQAFARPQLFTLLYSAVGILQSAHFYYFFAIMSTLQRRYGLSSWSVTVVLFADSASPFLVSFLVGHYSRRVSKPLLMFCAILALVVSCGISALPFFLYGPGLGAVDFKDSQEQLSSCQFDRTPLAESICEDQGMPESVVVTAVLFAANCFYGAAYSVLFISGSTYVDDSVKKKNSPLHFATVAILKLAGPTLGYALGSVCLRYYEDPRCESIGARHRENRPSLGGSMVARVRGPGRLSCAHGSSRAPLPAQPVASLFTHNQRPRWQSVHRQRRAEGRRILALSAVPVP